MIGHQDGIGTGIQGFESALDGHNALDDKGQPGNGLDLAQLLHGLAACRWGHTPQEGQPRGIHVHGYGKSAARLDHGHFFLNELQVPGLHGGHAQAADLADGLGGLDHDVGVQAVAGEGGNAGLGAAADQGGVVGLVVIKVAVVHGHRAYGTGKQGGRKGPPEEGEAGVRLAVRAEGIHVDPDPLPHLVVANGGVAYAFGTGAGHGVPAGQTIAHRAGLALAHIAPGSGHNFTVIHW